MSHSMKQTLLMAVLINILIPWGIATDFSAAAIAMGALAFVLKAFALAIFIGIFESSLAKTRFFGLPSLFMTAFFLAVITIFLGVFR
jgi:formate hydrogenlyase subunit 4